MVSRLMLGKNVPESKPFLKEHTCCFCFFTKNFIELLKHGQSNSTCTQQSIPRQVPLTLALFALVRHKHCKASNAKVGSNVQPSRYLTSKAFSLEQPPYFELPLYTLSFLVLP